MNDQILREERTGEATVASDVLQDDRVNGVPVSALQKFSELRSRREELSLAAKNKIANSDRRKQRREEKRYHPSAAEVVTESPTNSKGVKSEWQEVKKFLDVNAHLSGPVGHGIRQPKSGLEEKINEAISDKDYGQAEILSDSLATREFGVRVDEAFSAKRYAAEKQKVKEVETQERKRHLIWGFETKERWQMKGNM